MNRTVKVGLLGLGTVGSGTYEIAVKQAEHIQKNSGVSIEIVKTLVRDVNRRRKIDVPKEILTSNPADILENPEIDLVVEVLGGVHPAADYMLRALQNGKHVVSANKAAIADQYEALTKAAKENHVLFRYEASVGGAIPVLTAIQNALAANTFSKVYGIVNGTTNYILTKMSDEGQDYQTALKKAQEMGYAEPDDPSADVKGIDARNKLSILIALCFGEYVHPSKIPTTGITEVTPEDIAAAASEGKRIKLIASAAKENGKLTYSVKPVALPKEHPLASVNYELNAVYVETSEAGELMFYGGGAGALPTGSAVMGDVIAVAKDIVKNSAYDL